MTYHLTSRTFDTEVERKVLEDQLKKKGFRHVSRISKLKVGEYRMIGDTSGPSNFEGRKQFGIEWCEDK